MKVRNGFVSNSSSSSFLLIGERIAVEDAESLIDKGDNIIFISSSELNEGKDIIENLTKSHIRFIAKHMDTYSYALYKPWLSDNSEGWEDGISVSLLQNAINNIPRDVKEVEIIRVRKDYHCHEDIQDFRDYYRSCNDRWWNDEEGDVE